MLNGWVLEDYPKTRMQAKMLAENGLQPTNVFHIRVPQETVYSRTQKDSIDQFECNRSIVADKLRFLEFNLPHVVAFYNRYVNNLVEIDGLKSQWFMEDKALSAINANIHARQQFSTNYFTNQPCSMQDTYFDRCIMKASLS